MQNTSDLTNSKSESGYFNGGSNTNTNRSDASHSPSSRYKAYAKRMDKFRGERSLVGSGNSSRKPSPNQTYSSLNNKTSAGYVSQKSEVEESKSIDMSTVDVGLITSPTVVAQPQRAIREESNLLSANTELTAIRQPDQSINERTDGQ